MPKTVRTASIYALAAIFCGVRGRRLYDVGTRRGVEGFALVLLNNAGLFTPTKSWKKRLAKVVLIKAEYFHLRRPNYSWLSLCASPISETRGIVMLPGSVLATIGCDTGIR
jgi:hypothetical protein